MIPIAPHITAFLRDRLAVERGASPQTCDTYAYAFKLLLVYASRQFRTPPSDLSLEQLDAPFVLDFLAHLQSDRANCSASRNARLAAIKAFMRFIEYRVPSALDQVHRVLAIPRQKTPMRLVRHLSPEEYQAILSAPDPTSRLGIRDRAMLYLALAAGLRVSELVGIHIDDLRFDGRYVKLQVRGKGRKERLLMLWKEVGRSLRAWLAIRGESQFPEIFLAAKGDPMSRSGFAHILGKHARAAAGKCPPLRGKRVSPHVLRHTCALNMLRATGDTRKVALWLGHASPQTTDTFYLPIDPTEKLEALSSMMPPILKPARFRPVDNLIASLSPRRYAKPGRAHRGTGGHWSRMRPKGST